MMSTAQEVTPGRMTPDPLSPTEMAADDFQYRPMPTLVPVSLAFVFLSLLSGLSDLLLVIPLVGVCLSLYAYYQISRAQGELSGSGLAIFSLATMMVMFLGFGFLHLYSYATEVPSGYSRISFKNDISKKGLVTTDGKTGVHPDVTELSNKPIYLKGYMFPFRETRGLTSFVLCVDSGECCFGGKPKPTDMILINMMDGMTVNYHDKQLIGVAGTLKIEPKYDRSGLTPIYQLDCKYFSPAKTWY